MDPFKEASQVACGLAKHGLTLNNSVKKKIYFVFILNALLGIGM